MKDELTHELGFEAYEEPLKARQKGAMISALMVIKTLQRVLTIGAPREGQGEFQPNQSVLKTYDDFVGASILYWIQLRTSSSKAQSSVPIC